MEARLWDPERISNIASVMSRYSQKLEEGDLIRLGIEGDPCYAYRSAEDAPVARVLSVQREEDGLVRFQAQEVGEHGKVLHMSNRAIDSKEVWEVLPSHLDTYRGRVLRQLGGGDAEEGRPAEDADRNEPAEEEDATFRNAAPSWMSRLETLEEMVNKMADRMERAPEYRGALQDMSALENELDVLRKDTLLAVRELCGDVLKTYRGEPAQFSQNFVDRYDRQYPDAEEERSGEPSRSSAPGEYAMSGEDTEPAFSAEGGESLYAASAQGRKEATHRSSAGVTPLEYKTESGIPNLMVAQLTPPPSGVGR